MREDAAPVFPPENSRNIPRFYLAPLEGITTYIYRNAYHRHYRPMDKYFLPFLVPHVKRNFNTREYRELLPEHNAGMRTVPQILTCNSADFVRTAKAMADLGYQEVNLNLGCPSKTVVNKKRGAGFLADPEALDRFFDAVFQELQLSVSVKTRTGMIRQEEFYRLLEIFNRYPIAELIIHPRVQQDFYKNRPDWDMFAVALAQSRNPVCYNGDLFTAEDYIRFRERFGRADRIMLGRGIIGNPALVEQCLRADGIPWQTDGETPAAARKRLYAFHQQIYQDYCAMMPEENNVLFKMKEIWSYLAGQFPDGGKWEKKIGKCRRLAEYESCVQALFSQS